jgi:hypothetical protein
VDVVFSSPLRRTIQTAALSFGPTLARKEVPFILIPALQEVGDVGSDTGIADTADDLKKLLPDLFAKGDLEFDLEKIDASAVTEGWNSKVGSRIGVCEVIYSLTSYRKATGRTRGTQSPDARQTSGIGCFSALRKK